MLNPDYKDILSRLNEEEVEYIVVGAYALAAHGLPRATGDIDLWINPSETNADSVWKVLLEFGAPLDELSINDLRKKGMVYQIGVAPNRIDIMTSIDGVEFPDAWNSRIVVEIDGLKINTISKEHLILNKQAVGRAQDLVDIERLTE